MKYILAFSFLFLVSTAVQCQTDTIDTKIKTFFKNNASQDELCKELKYSDRTEIARSLVPFAKDENTYERALELAIRLRVPGLHVTFKKHVESGVIPLGSENQKKLIELAFRTKDKVVSKYYDIFKSTDNHDVWKLIYEALCTYPVELTLITKMYSDWEKAKIDEEIKPQLGYIIQTQMCLDHDVESKLWKTDLAYFTKTGQPFKLTGFDLLQYEDCTIKNGFMTGFNLILNKDSSVTVNLNAERWQRKSIKIKFRCYAPESARISIGLNCGNGTWEAITSDKKQWTLLSQKGGTVSRKHNEWFEVVFSITDKSPKEGAIKQMLSLQVGGMELMPSGGAANDGLQDFWVSCTEDSIIVGGFEIEG